MTLQPMAKRARVDALAARRRGFDLHALERRARFSRVGRGLMEHRTIRSKAFERPRACPSTAIKHRFAVGGWGGCTPPPRAPARTGTACSIAPRPPLTRRTSWRYPKNHRAGLVNARARPHKPAAERRFAMRRKPDRDVGGGAARTATTACLSLSSWQSAAQTARTGRRRTGVLSALHAHAKASYKIDLVGEC